MPFTLLFCRQLEIRRGPKELLRCVEDLMVDKERKENPSIMSFFFSEIIVCILQQKNVMSCNKIKGICRLRTGTEKSREDENFQGT